MPRYYTPGDGQPGLLLEKHQQMVQAFNALRNAIRVDPRSEDVDRCFEAFAHTYSGPTRTFVVAFAPPAQRIRWTSELFARLSYEIPAEAWNSAPPPMPC